MLCRNTKHFFLTALALMLATAMSFASLPAQEPAKAPVSNEPLKVQPIHPGPFNLAEEAKAAKHAEIKSLLEDAANPADIVSTVNGKHYRATPIAKRFDPRDTKPLSFRTIGGESFTFQPDQIKEVSQYEIRLIATLRAFLDKRFDTAKENQPALSRFMQLRAAEMVLVELSNFHKGALAQQTRQPASWAGVQDEINNFLFSVRIDELRALQAERDYVTAEALATRLFQETPGNRVLLETIEQVFLKQADEFLNQNQFLNGRLRLETLRDKYRNPLTSTLTKRMVERLEEHARKNADVAKQAVESNDRSKALAALEEAEQAWPTFPGLRELREKLLGEYGVLRIGVRTLPRNVSPLTVMTDVDRIASQLMFEPLITARAAPSIQEGYRLTMTEAPKRLLGGYEFVLPVAVKWSDGKPLKSEDVIRSLELLSKPGTSMYNPALQSESAQNNPVFSSQPLDESRIAFSFKSPTLDPLAYLQFPILPAHRLTTERPMDPAFDKQPTGTGPYFLAGQENDEVIFRANPHYKRAHAPQGPVIKEIRFIKYANWGVARSAFLDGRWQILLEASSKEVEDLAGQPQSLIYTPTEQRGSYLTNPRIYFLAFNYRKPYFQKKETREMIYYAINRESILTAVFRGKNRQLHQVLNGPYPVNSWAYDPVYSGPNENPYDTVKHLTAKSKADKLPNPVRLVVLADDQQGLAACNMIKEELQKGAINVAVAPLSAAALALELSKEEPNFDLLYTSYDFDSELLHIRPLLDPSAANGQGRNYMGYQRNSPDNDLMRFILESQNSRALETVKQKMNAIHGHIVKNAIFVPLWQLDRHIAVHRNLDKYNRFHPLYVFDGVENWVLKSGKQ